LIGKRFEPWKEWWADGDKDRLWVILMIFFAKPDVKNFNV
jgi:hypothetical protein